MGVRVQSKEGIVWKVIRALGIYLHVVKSRSQGFRAFQILFCLAIYSQSLHGATYYTRSVGGNWNSTSTWSTVSCNGAIAATIPGAGDDVVICNSSGASAVTVTVNGVYACRNLIIGTGAANATIQTSNAAYSLTVHGDVSFNQGNESFVYTLSASSGTVNLLGDVIWNSVNGTNRFLVSTGNIAFNNDIAITQDNQQITFSNIGKVYFLGNFEDSQNNLYTYAGCSVIFSGNYTITGEMAHWNTTASMVFNGLSSVIQADEELRNGKLIVKTGAGLTILESLGAVTLGSIALESSTQLTINHACNISGDVILGNSAVLSLNKQLNIAKGWTNNGGQLNATSGASVFFTGYGYSIGGSSPTTFPHLHVGATGASSRYSLTINANLICDTLTLETNSNSGSSTVTLGTSNPTVQVLGALNMQQLSKPTSATFRVNGGQLSVGGDLSFIGTVNHASQLLGITVTSGSFSLQGGINWMNQSGTALTATEVISVTTGTLNFASSMSLPKGSGSIKVSGAGTINFNGTVQPSLDINSAGTGTTLAVFTTVANSKINFKKGFKNSNSATFTFASGSTVKFIETSTVSPVAQIRFGYVIIDAGVTLTTTGHLAVQNTWQNLGAFVPGNYTVTFNGGSSTLQSVSRAGGETFYGLSLATSNGTFTANCNIKVTGSLALSGHNVNLNGFSLQLGDGASAAISRTRGAIYGGNFSRYWPANTAVTSSGGVALGLFPVGTATSYRPLTINSTVSPSTGGLVTVTHTHGTTVTETSVVDGVNTIERISDQHSTIAVSGVSGGTYTLNVYFAGFNTLGTTADLRLLTNTGGSPAVYGTHVSTSGTATSPVCKRSGMSISQLANVFVAGTRNKAATPIIAYIYSRTSNGNWNDPDSWSLTPGGAGASCACVPLSGNFAVISSGQTIQVGINTTVDYLTVESNGEINGTANFLVTKELILQNGAKMQPTSGVWSAYEFIANGTATYTINTPFTVDNLCEISAGSTIHLGANMNVAGDLNINGALHLNGNTLILNGAATRTITGTGTIDGAGGQVNITTANKTILSSADITFNANVSFANNIKLTNEGTIRCNNNLIGANSSAGLINTTGANAYFAADVFNTGSLTATEPDNNIFYIGNSSQVVKATIYDNLVITGSGAKTAVGNFSVNNHLKLEADASLNTGTYIISGAGDLEMTSGALLQLQRGSSGTFPELTGTYQLNGGTISINQTGGIATLQGADYYNLTITGSRPFSFEDVSSVNNLNILSGASMINQSNLHIDSTLNYQSSATTTLTADLDVHEVVLDAGTLNDGGNIINVSGDFTKNAGNFISSELVRFNGNSTQIIGGSSSITFNKLQNDNSSLGGIELHTDVQVLTKLELVRGVIFSSVDNIISILDNAEADEGAAGSYVDGPMQKIGDDAFVFPIGDNGKWARAAISAPSDAATVFTAEYKRQEYANVVSLDEPLKKVSKLEYWMLDRAVTTSAVEVTLYWQNNAESEINNCQDLQLAHWNGTVWEKIPNSKGGSCNGAGYITSSAALTDFSPFTFGSETVSNQYNPLPVELLEFTAYPQGNVVNVAWSTASETNNRSFIIERSEDGVNFSKIGNEVPGANNSSVYNFYKTIDASPIAGTTYYRLVQTDFNGKQEYFDPVAVSFNNELNAEAGLFTVYPNPSSFEDLTIQVSSKLLFRNIQLRIIDFSGNVVFNEDAIILPTQKTKLSAYLNGLNAGLYTLQLSADGIIECKRFFVSN